NCGICWPERAVWKFAPSGTYPHPGVNALPTLIGCIRIKFHSPHGREAKICPPFGVNPHSGNPFAQCTVEPRKQAARFIMTEERTTTYETPDGGSHTTTTIVTDAPSRSRGAGMWLVAIVLLVAVIGGLYVFSELG